jgi:hypothetical protein
MGEKVFEEVNRMAIAEDMKRLTEDIRVANDARLRAVGSLMTQTRETLRTFRTGRSKMATDQAKDLAGYTSELCKDVDAMRRKAHDLIQEFEKANKQMSREQSKHLAGFAQGLTHEVSAMMSRFDKEHGRMSKDLTDRLTGQIADIKTAVEQIIKDAGGFINEQHSGMVQARQAWQNMARTMAKTRKTGMVAPAAKTEQAPRAAKHAGCKTCAKKGTAKKKQM